ncbi:hypothetical protein GXY_11893 [Novacetimonas hansenii ATCC 23769]|uniref:Uncharacterized protein n=1 Tax=Novacetimonas hansenii ATCC 23769 TaxID=714995 RepID=D5QGV6_NOVHA|nr:hypothetical protein GXY_11893 [Novacetimonas hansenii ATCC 23769]
MSIYLTFLSRLETKEAKRIIQTAALCLPRYFQILKFQKTRPEAMPLLQNVQMISIHAKTIRI